ncbi:hypothetical protein [Actinophytocola sp. KF-1]
MRSGLRAALGAALTAAAVAGGLTATATQAAAVSYGTLAPASWARIDSRAPEDTITSGDARVGAFRDSAGKHHVSKAYFTFDLSSYRGGQVFTAGLIAPQLAAADCERAVAVELWRTTPAPAPTWYRQPAELTRFAGPNQIGCPSGQLGWDVSTAIADAVAAGRDRITFGVRVSEAHQGDVAFGRTLSSRPYLRLTYNSPPDVPTGLSVDTHDCAEPGIVYAPGFGWGVPLWGSVSDPDGPSSLTVRAQVWNTADPGNVYEVVPDAWTGAFRFTYPDSLSVDGTYQWRARTEDSDGAVSAWTAPCTFTLDRTRPDVEPTVESDYFVEDGGPPGATGPGTFTFGANGVADVAGYQWSGIGVTDGEVRTDAPGGSATVTILPTSDGPASISVYSFDAAGNMSPARTYRFWVLSNAPTTSFRNQHYFGERVPVTLTATQSGAATFTYSWAAEDGAPEHTVPVGADGTAAIVVDMPRSGPTAYRFTAWSTDADRQRSQTYDELVHINDAEPWIDLSAWHVAVGETVTAVVDPVFLGDVATYVWRVDGGPEQVVVPEADDSARFTYVPAEAGDHLIEVWATYANGGFSGTARVGVTAS